MRILRRPFLRWCVPSLAIMLVFATTLLACRIPIQPQKGIEGGVQGLSARLLPRDLPRDFSLTEPIESYGPDDLWKKIDGADALYLAYGFDRLLAAAYGRPGAQLPELEVSIYDMATPLNALGVFLAERSLEADSVAIGWDGYQTETGLFFHKGPYYVKIVDLSADGSLGAVARAAGEAIDQRVKVKENAVPQLEVFPEKDRIAGSVLYVRSNALGHGFLEHVFQADYEIGGQRVTLFYTLNDNPDQLLAEYRKYGQEFGSIEREGVAENLERFLVIRAFDKSEIVFVSNGVFGGVIGDIQAEQAFDLINRLLANIEKQLQAPGQPRGGDGETEG